MIGHNLERYPFPIAYPARSLSVAGDTADRLEKAAHFVELTATTLAVLVLAWCRANSRSTGAVQQWHRRLEPSGITLDTWITVAQSSRTVMAGSPADPVARAVRLSAEAAGPVLKTFNPTRNVYAHGGKPRLRADQETAAGELDGGVSAILDGIKPLTRIRLGLITDCQAADGSYQASLEVLAGSGEPFPRRRLRSPRAYGKGAVIAYHHDSLDFAVDLTPFCIWRSCPACHRDELFYLHQRKKQRDLYFSFSTGHELTVKGAITEPAPKRATTMRAEPLGSVRAAATAGWRASWADLASRMSRIAARLVDLTLAVLVGAVGWALASLIGVRSPVLAAAIALLLAVGYEPVTALTGGTLGKRLLGISAISVWDCRPLNRADTLRRALFADLQLLLPPIIIYNMAWVLWDPARQCLHDRRVASIVIAGRSQHGRKV